MSRPWYLLGACVLTRIVRDLLPPHEIGVADNAGHRVLQSTHTDAILADRVTMWVDPPYTSSRPCEKRTIWSFRRVKFVPEAPVSLEPWYPASGANPEALKP